LQLAGPERYLRLLAQAETSPAETEAAGTETPAPQETKPEEAKQPGVETQQPQPMPFPRLAPRRETAPRQPSPGVGGPVSFFFDDADVFEVIQTVFGDVLKANYIIDPKVKGKVTFRTITPIPREEVLSVMEIILRINGTGFVEEKGLYRIVPLTDVPKELVYSQVGKDPDKVAIELFTFKNMNIKESMPDIENAIGLNTQGGSMRVLPIQRLNALMVVASSKEQMEYVRKWIEAFDSMFANARPKIVVYPLQNSKASHIGPMLQSILGAGGGSVGGAAPAASAPKPPTQPGQTTSTTSTPATPQAPKPGPVSTAVSGGGTGFLVSPDTRIFADEINNSLIVLSTPADYAFIEETIKKIDTAPRQVVIESLLVRVDLTDNLDFGMQWTIQNDVTIKGFKPFNNDINISGPLTLKTPITNPTFTFTALDAVGNVKLLLQSLATQGKAKILASPHILVSDNREARIQVGQQIPLATSTTTQPLTTTTTTVATVASTSTIQYKDIGIILTVKPQINDSGLVSLQLTQEVSSQGADVNIAGQAFASINKTEATTELVALDGETIIIGGLIREDNTRARSGIPFLSRIPVLGYLFGSTNDDTTRAELIILLTPHVVRNMQEASSVTSDYIEKYKGVAKDKSIDEFILERSQKGKNGGNAGAGDVK
jgi:general secretion pathway protein D